MGSRMIFALPLLLTTLLFLFLECKITKRSLNFAQKSIHLDNNQKEILKVGRVFW